MLLSSEMGQTIYVVGSSRVWLTSSVIDLCDLTYEYAESEGGGHKELGADSLR